MAFENCKSLTNITISDSVSDSVTSIGDEAFGYCKSLTTIVISGTEYDADLFCSYTQWGKSSVQPKAIMKFLEIEDQKKRLSNLKKKFMKVIRSKIETKDYSGFQVFVKKYNPLSKRNIDGLIEYAFEKKTYNIFSELLIYKYENFKFTLEQFDKYLEMAKDNTEIVAYLLEKKNLLFPIEDTTQNEWDAMEAELAKMEDEMKTLQ